MNRRFIFDVLSDKTELIRLPILGKNLWIYDLYLLIFKFWWYVFFCCIIVFLWWGFCAYQWGILRLKNRRSSACWSCLRRRQLITYNWLLLVLENSLSVIIDINWCFIGSLVLFDSLLDASKARLSFTFLIITSKWSLISSMSWLNTHLNVCLRRVNHSNWRFWHLLVKSRSLGWRLKWNWLCLTCIA